MKKLSIGLLVAVATTLLSGCALYFGEGHNDSDDTWNYCGADGYYTCEDEQCTWVSATCPEPGGGSGGQTGGGFECRDDADCAAGCYCENGLCEEAGFCTQDSDCGEGYVCDVDRSSCVPGDQPPATCDWDSECPQGQYCAADHTCTATCVCSDDETAVAQGFGWCDETRQTCLPGADPVGSCGGEADASCTTAKPACASGSVPLLFGGCYTGECRAYAECDVNPVCSHINDQQNCLGRSGDCSPVYTGINCTKPDGTACQGGDTGCTCQSFTFASCQNKTASPRMVTSADGYTIDASWLQLK